MIVRGAIVSGSGNVTVSVPAVLDGFNLKEPASLPDVRLEFQNLSVPGVATLDVRTDMLPPPPAGHQFGSPPYIYDLATTATAATIRLCIDTAGMTFADAANARLYRLEGTLWNPQSPPLAGGGSLCAQTSTLGSFAIFTPVAPGSAAVTLAGTGTFPDVITNPDGSTTVPDGGLAIDTALLGATGAAIDRTRNVLYVSTLNRIRRVDLTTGIITTIAGNGAYPEITFELGTGILRLADPDDQRVVGSWRLALDAHGRLYIADRCRVLRFDPDTNTLTRFAGDGYCRSAGDGLPANQASVMTPTGLAFDQAGHLFVADVEARVVRRVDAGTGLISTVAGGGTAAIGAGQPARSSSLTPVDIAVGRNGDLYIVQNDPFLLRLETGGDGVVNGQPGEILHVVNTCALTACPALPFGGDGHPVASATFHLLLSIAVEPSGDLLVGEFQRSRIRRISAGANGVADGVVRTAASFDATHGDPVGGSSFFLNGEGFALSSAIEAAGAIAVDPAGGFVWADSGRPLVRHTGSAAAGSLADVSIVASASPSPVSVGSTLTYSVTATNHGPNTAHAVRVSLPVADTLTFVASTPAGSCSGPPADTAGTISCTLGDLASGVSTSIQIATRPAVAGSLAVTLTVSSDETDTNTTNNAAAVSIDVTLAQVVIEVTEIITVTDASVVLPAAMVTVSETITVTDASNVVPAVMVNIDETIHVADDVPAMATTADLAITAIATPTTVDTGSTVRYTATVTNNGPATGTGVTISMPVTAGFTVNSFSFPSGTCTVPLVGVAGTIACTASTPTPLGGPAHAHGRRNVDQPWPAGYHVPRERCPGRPHSSEQRSGSDGHSAAGDRPRHRRGTVADAAERRRIADLYRDGHQQRAADGNRRVASRCPRQRTSPSIRSTCHR